MEYKITKDFMRSLRDLNSKGGSFSKAGDRIKAVLFTISNNEGDDDPLKGLPTTVKLYRKMSQRQLIFAIVIAPSKAA